MEQNGLHGQTAEEASARRRLLEERRKQRARRRRTAVVFFASLFLLVLISGAILSDRFMPTKQTMPLTDYFVQTEADELSVIINGEYEEPKEGEMPRAITADGSAFLSLYELKHHIDGRYF